MKQFAAAFGAEVKSPEALAAPECGARLPGVTSADLAKAVVLTQQIVAAPA